MQIDRTIAELAGAVDSGGHLTDDGIAYMLVKQRSGDKLSCIAKRYGLTWSGFVEAFDEAVESGRLIRIQNELKASGVLPGAYPIVDRTREQYI